MGEQAGYLYSCGKTMEDIFEVHTFGDTTINYFKENVDADKFSSASFYKE
ncbi:hypothetical protein QYZ87_07955 [Porphyromonadaceae bacterium W3.11]|nr:hypothetical protein [Porphyromonadaceae bacterium W3.11]